ncbi:MAG: hypothetical protein ACI4DK_01745 [Lachnospiraceae bacterium]
MELEDISKNVEEVLSWMQTEADYMTLPDWGKYLAKIQWNGVLTTSVDYFVEKMLRFEMREIQPIYQYWKELRVDIENEAAYYVNIDYFYGLFFERCDIYREFIMQKVLLFNLEYEKVKTSMALIHDLRTYKSHTLDKVKAHDKEVIERIENGIFD